MTAEDMLKCFQTNEWMDDKIDFINPDDPNDVNNSEFCFEEEKVKLVSNHQIEIIQLKSQIDNLRNQLTRKSIIPKTIEKEVEVEQRELKDDDEVESLEDLKALENTIRKKKNKSTKKVIEMSEDGKLCQHLAELEKELFDDLI
jgi:isoleucyl-tRNA synthetase